MSVSLSLAGLTAAGPAANESESWDAISAIATAFGAIGTVGALAFLYLQSKGTEEAAEWAQKSAEAAQRTAEAAGESARAAREEAAGAWRPVLTVAAATLTYRDGADDPGGTAKLSAAIRNVGRGPALRVRVFFEPLVAAGDPRLSNANREARSLDSDWFGLLPADEGREVGPREHPGPFAESYAVHAFYTDLGGLEYETFAVLDLRLNSTTSGFQRYDLLPNTVLLPRGGDEDSKRLAETWAAEEPGEPVGISASSSPNG